MHDHAWPFESSNLERSKFESKKALGYRSLEAMLIAGIRERLWFVDSREI